jgi:hypothetical protein
MGKPFDCEFGCEGVDRPQPPAELDYLPNLNISDARIKLIAAEMTLANIRAMCVAFQNPTTAQISGLLDAIYEIANRTMDAPAKKALQVLGQVNSFKDNCRDLGQTLLAFAGLEEHHDETKDRETEVGSGPGLQPQQNNP